MRYICKACGRKREQRELYAVGFAHNNQRIWLCRGYVNSWSNCNTEFGVAMLKRLNVPIHVSLSDLNNNVLYGTPLPQVLDVLAPVPTASRDLDVISRDRATSSFSDLSDEDFLNSLSPDMREYFSRILNPK